MNTLPRYLRREIGLATGFVLFALLAIFAFFELVGELENVGLNGYTLRAALFSVLLSLPSRLYELMPIGALIGTIYALSKLAANSEFTIMRVSGMSTRRLAVWVLRTGVLIVAATYLLGEVIAPPAERLARQVKFEAMNRVITEFRSGVWARDVVRSNDGTVERLRFVNVREMRTDATASQWRIFEFDNQFRLRSMLVAERGAYEAPADGGPAVWRLTNVVETRVPVVEPAATERAAATTEVVREGERVWVSELTPQIFGVLLVRPERMGMVALAQYVRHLEENRQRSDLYEIALWNKIVYPLAILVMMALALPFAYLHVRQGGVSMKIFSGVMLGVGFYMLNKLFSHLGVLNTWPPILVAVMPSLLVLTIALAALYWIERR
ncbi:MAG: LPS export ABC transporter permease LptG [Burkholderiales bacterium]|jgi:lipopolysaccharide export system permease protein|nr:LPS export ABC transporter permease LptG [Burkholderiales bacterium]